MLSKYIASNNNGEKANGCVWRRWKCRDIVYKFATLAERRWHLLENRRRSSSHKVSDAAIGVAS